MKDTETKKDSGDNLEENDYLFLEQLFQVPPPLHSPPPHEVPQTLFHSLIYTEQNYQLDLNLSSKRLIDNVAKFVIKSILQMKFKIYTNGKLCILDIKECI